MISSLAETEALLVPVIVPCTVPYLPMYALSVGSIPYKLGSLCFVQYQEYIRDKSVQPCILACVTTFF